MDAEIARLFVSVDARLNGLETGLKTSERISQQSGRAIEGSLKGVATQSGKTSETVKRHAKETVAENVLLTGSFRSMARQAVLAGGATAGAYLAISKARGAIQFTNELAHTTLQLHRNLGLTVTTASSLASVLKARGIDTNSAAYAFQTLSRQIVAAQNGSKTAEAAFMAIGIPIKDLKAAGGDLNVLLPRIAEGFGNLKGNSDRAAVSQALLSRGYKSLLPLFSQGAKGFNDQLDAAKRYGAVLDESALKKQEELIRSQRQLQLASMGLKIAFTQAVTPALAGLSTEAAHVAAILHGPGSLDDKLQHISQVIAPAFKSVETAVEHEIPNIANAAGHAAPKVAGAFINGFLDADSWGKLALGAFFVSKTIGWKVFFAKSGALAATAFSGSLAATGTPEDAAAGAAGGTAYGTAFSAAAKRVPIFGPNGQVIKEVEQGVKDIAPLGAAAGVGWFATFKGKILGEGAGFRLLGLGLGDLIGIGIAAGIIAELPKIEGALGKILGLGPSFSNEARRGFKDLIGGGLIFPESTAKNDTYSGGARNAPYFPGAGFNNPAKIDNSVFKGSHGAYYTKAELEKLWIAAGGPVKQANLAASIALAESGGPGATKGYSLAQNKSGASGLWQILGQVVKGDVFDPGVNAQNAVKKFNARGFQPWQAYTNGSYKQFLSLPGLDPNSPSYIDLINQLNAKSKKAKKGPLIPGDLAWAQRMLGHFKETTGQNTGPELDQLQREFGTHAAQWCAEFVTAALVKAGFPKSIKTPRVKDLNEWAASGKHGLSFTNDPKAGDVITLGNQHTAIVESVDRHKGVVHVISGNSDTSGPGSQGVMRRTYAIGSGRYISVNAAAGSDPGNVTRTPKPTAYDRLQKTLTTLQLAVQAGVLSARDAAEAERQAIEKALPHLHGDNKLNALVTLKGLPKFKPKFDTRGLALAYLGLHPGSVDPKILKAAGVNTTLDNPWLKSYLGGIDNSVGSGAMTEDAGNRAKRKQLQSALPYLAGQSLADAKTQIKQLTDAIDANTRSQIDQTSQLEQGAGGIGQSIVSLLGKPGGKALLAGLIPQGVDQIPGGLSISQLLGSANPGQAVSDFLKNSVLPSEIAQFSAPGLSDADRQAIWQEILGTLGEIAGSTQDTADNTSQANDELKKQNQDLAKRLGVSQSQYAVFDGTRGMARAAARALPGAGGGR